MSVAGSTRAHRLRHVRTVEAPAEVLYDLVADVSRWPILFQPTVHAAQVAAAGPVQRLEICAVVNGEVKAWTSRRDLGREGLSITFEQERSAAPIATMGGSWTFRQRHGGTEVVLDHHFTAVGDDLRAIAWIEDAVDANSVAELEALARIAEIGHPVEELMFIFEDVIELPGAAADIYAFLFRADLWPDRLPHVSRATLTEPSPGVQILDMDTATADGSTHATRSVRLCSPTQHIVYKQLLPPALLLGHCGAWHLREEAHGTVVTARHTVAIDPSAVETALGRGTTLEAARRWVRDALGANSRATLDHAVSHARGTAAS